MWRDGEFELLCVLGPTASGKTRYAVNLAMQLRSLGIAVEIISADSRQIYRGMTIGTGKDLAEYGDVPYHLIDIVDAGERYDLFSYQHDFNAAYEDIVSRGALPLLCGGTGLYIDAVTRGYALAEVAPDQDAREELEALGHEELKSMLLSLDPEASASTLESKRRTIRAIEIARHGDAGRVDARGRKTYFIGTLVTREERNARIDARLDARLEEGMIEEVRSLIENGLHPDDLIYYGLEYKFVTLYVTGEIGFEQMRERLAIAIHQFAKRQMTYFRGMERRGTRIHWVKMPS
ncbi:MAG: tRNA (adenosine(37)-N6)-dimethylallyltransferase MiaA [Bacteroidales bacterium]|nr:tRNA (adenosine(37)-N6)-dimethylallyltransferase MiaA [Bacteroidales bacterium]